MRNHHGWRDSWLWSLGEWLRDVSWGIVFIVTLIAGIITFLIKAGIITVERIP